MDFRLNPTKHFHQEVGRGPGQLVTSHSGGFVAELVMNVSQFIMTVPVLGTQMQAELSKRDSRQWVAAR